MTIMSYTFALKVLKWNLAWWLSENKFRLTPPKTHWNEVHKELQQIRDNNCDSMVFFLVSSWCWWTCAAFFCWIWYLKQRQIFMCVFVCVYKEHECTLRSYLSSCSSMVVTMRMQRCGFFLSVLSRYFPRQHNQLHEEFRKLFSLLFF